jgi:hypothetical protein
MVEDTRRTATQSVYKPRNPRKTPLWRILNGYFGEFVSVYEDRFESRYGRLSPYVQKVVERYLRCGILDFGFARIRCADCGREMLLAFSCKCRSFCPSCQKRRQLEFAEFCVSEVFAPVPHRQVVLAIPKRIRLHFFRNRKLLSKLARCGWETLRDFLQAAVGRDDAVPGAVVAIQTFGNLGDLTPHLHMIVSWGCFDERGTFYAVREAPEEDMIEQVFRHKVFRMLLDAGAVTEDLVNDLLAWHHSGFSAYVGKPVPARDTESLESLAQYIVRGAVAQERLSVSEGLDGTSRVTYRSKKVHPGHGANFRVLDVLDFIALLVAHIPARHEKRAINYGFYSNKSRGVRRRKLEAQGNLPAKSQAEIVSATEDRAPLEVRRAWAYLVAKVYEVDPLVCPECGGRMKPIAYIQDKDVIFRILNHLNLLPEESPGTLGRSPPDDRAPARSAEIVCEPFYDDLEPGEAAELMMATADVGRN